MALGVRQVLECDVSVLELDRIRALHLHDGRGASRLFENAFECYDDALPVRDIIKIPERNYPGLYRLVNRNLVYRTRPEVEQSVPSHDTTVAIEGLEHYQLVLREFHISTHLLVEIVQSSGATHLIDSVETLDTVKGNPELINHKPTLFNS